MSMYDWAWAAWAGWFVFWETLALFDPRKDDTLTENLRPLIQSTTGGWIIAGLFLLWLAWHFLVEGRG